jgi:hypothetical protein
MSNLQEPKSVHQATSGDAAVGKESILQRRRRDRGGDDKVADEWQGENTGKEIPGLGGLRILISFDSTVQGSK